MTGGIPSSRPRGMRRDPPEQEQDPIMWRTTASHRRLVRPHWLRAAGLAFLLAAAALSGPQAARAQRDNIDRLREAIDSDRSLELDRLAPDSPLLTFRAENLSKRA